MASSASCLLANEKFLCALDSSTLTFLTRQTAFFQHHDDSFYFMDDDCILFFRINYSRQYLSSLFKSWQKKTILLLPVVFSSLRRVCAFRRFSELETSSTQQIRSILLSDRTSETSCCLIVVVLRFHVSLLTYSCFIDPDAIRAIEAGIHFTSVLTFLLRKG